MVNKKILVCCGTGIATSVQVANKLQRMLRDRGVAATMKECKTANVPAQIEAFHPDAIVVTTAITFHDEGIKVYRGTPLLTGVGASELADQIADDLKALDD
ncbi:PTS sugar transporter subunit IIB [Cutibacterium sp.]|uniref:PTS sugar transporter subunit IIB n=1 Tax=Cutibacterium sp. TaxID=1912221 RepID=UPI0026DD223F|nr:PTS sugar transporter subunit IIB [Cutibacterium sp.]MDO4412845.1 PTS sugar transporter subunit IIB [Cutibacterium sp.]